MKHIDTRLEAYVAGELDAAQSHAITAHLAECPVCAARVDEARELWALLGTAMDPVPSQRLSPSAWPGVRARTFGHRTRPWSNVATALVAVAAGLALAVWLPTPSTSESESAVIDETALGSSFWLYEDSESTFSELWLVAADEGSGS